MKTGKYVCKCYDKFYGPKCEKEVRPCASHPCFGESACVVKGNNYLCLCIRGKTGKNCEKYVNYCKGVTCQNGGKCISVKYKFLCICEKTNFGKNCQFWTSNLLSHNTKLRYKISLKNILKKNEISGIITISIASPYILITLANTIYTGNWMPKLKITRQYFFSKMYTSVTVCPLLKKAMVWAPKLNRILHYSVIYTFDKNVELVYDSTQKVGLLQKHIYLVFM